MDINEIAEKLNRIKVKKESISEILNVRIGDGRNTIAIITINTAGWGINSIKINGT